MTRTAFFARCSAAAATATLLAGLVAAPAIARVDPGEPTSQQIQVYNGPNKAQIEHKERLFAYDGSTKAQVEHEDQLFLDGRTKAQIEHDEALSSVPSTDGEEVSAPADEFPWAVASFAATGLAAVAAGGVVMLRQRRSSVPLTA